MTFYRMILKQLLICKSIKEYDAYKFRNNINFLSLSTLFDKKYFYFASFG